MDIAAGKGQIIFGTGRAQLTITTENWAAAAGAGGVIDDRQIILTLMAQEAVGHKQHPTADRAGAVFEKEVVFEKGQQGLFEIHGYLAR